MSEGLESPRIAAFRRQADQDPAGAVADLRNDLARAAGPLVEPVDGDSDHVLVTFCWLGPADGEVSVRCQLLQTDSAYPSHPLRQIKGTELWLLSTLAPRDARVTYQFAVDDPFLGLDDRAFVEDFDELVRSEVESLHRCYADPANPRRILPLAAAMTEINIDPAHWESILTLAEPTQPAWVGSQPAQTGRREDVPLSSTVLANERTVTVWTPEGLESKADALPLVVALDGEWWLHVAHLDQMLAHLIAAGRIEPMVAVFVHNPTIMSRMIEMSCNSDHTKMLCDELLPSIRSEFRFAGDPRKLAILGASYGGLAAAFTAFERPDCFGNSISFSGSFWWGLDDPKSQYSWGRDDEPEWLTREVATSQKKPVRFWLEVGLLETGTEAISNGIGMIASNRHFRTVLQAKGYEVHYREPCAGHDFASWAASTPGALEWFAGQTRANR